MHRTEHAKMRSIASFLVCLAALPAAAASFDCNKAATPDEFAICGDPQLSNLDSKIAAAFAQARDAAGKATALSIARAFMAQRKACGGDKACIMASQEAVLERYRAVGASGVPPT